ncbi:MAG: hypothetical protein DI582_04810 [Azospirillum brasilense]|nr:MAG: hypothetical protein DI582_04810 [Azospirillum brasilense]
MERTRSPHVPLVSPKQLAALKEAQFAYASAAANPEGTLAYFQQLREASVQLLRQMFTLAEEEAAAPLELPPIPPEVLDRYAGIDRP